MSRVAITLDEHALAELKRRAQSADEPVSRAAARMVRDALLANDRQSDREHAQILKTPPSQAESGRPAWLEPLSERQAWRRALWAAVAALAQRYPRQLADLPAFWWQDRGLTETLAAVCHWRAQLDGAGATTDPRTELLFQDRLEIVRRQLSDHSDPTAARFTPGPPPAEWVG